MYEYLEKEVESQNHLPFLFPIAVKEKNLKKEKEHAGFTPEVFWVSEAGDKKIEDIYKNGLNEQFFTHNSNWNVSLGYSKRKYKGTVNFS